MTRLPLSFVLGLGLLFTACGSDDDDTGTAPEVESPDSDGDGVPDDEDCLPDDPWSYPGADDIPYDGVDNDCAGDGDLVDYDGDGYIGEGADGDDCNDNNPDIHPGAEDECLDGTDSDCDETTSEYDCDRDGYDRESAGGEDCEDYDAERYPGAEEIWYDGVDQDCDGWDDCDQDGDGDYPSECGGDDCDDLDPERSTTQEEVCGDGIDNDCDGTSGDCTPEGEAEADATEVTLLGPTAGQRFGTALSGGHDLDGDGLDDLVVGAPGDSSGGPDAGAVMVVLGPLLDGDVDPVGTWITGSLGEEAGEAVSILGDGDGDGAADLLVAAPGNSAGATDGGAVYLIRGPIQDDLDLAASNAHWLGDESGALLGTSLDAIDDMDGDGFPDVLAGAPGGFGGGHAYVFSGAAIGSQVVSDAHLSIAGSSASDGVGTAVAAAGDLDGDGIADLAVGAPGAADGAGEVWVFLGPVSGTLTSGDEDASFVGADAGDAAGAGLARGHDIDGDGLDDLLIGAPGQDGSGEDAGLVYIVGDATTSAALDDITTTLAGENAGDEAGGVLTGLGDSDADGYADFLIGTPGRDYSGQDSGRVYFFVGPIESAYMVSTAKAAWHGTLAGDETGTAVANGGDLTGDGYIDLVFGSPGRDDLGADAGAVHVAFGGGI